MLVLPPTFTSRSCATELASTTNTLNSSPSGTSASSGTTIADARMPTAIAPNTVSPIRNRRRVVGASHADGDTSRRRIDRPGDVEHRADAERLTGRRLAGADA